MRCPACKTTLTKVIRTEPGDDGTRRRRRCLDPACGHRWTTFESAADATRVELEPASMSPRAGQRIARALKQEGRRPRPGLDPEAIAAAMATDRRRAQIYYEQREQARRQRELDQWDDDAPPSRLDRESFRRETGFELPED
jgi:hypothetical protein